MTLNGKGPAMDAKAVVAWLIERKRASDAADTEFRRDEILAEIWDEISELERAGR